MSIQLEKEQLNRLFPFYIQINQHLVITACGSSIKKISALQPGHLFTDYFEVLRPKMAIVNFSTLDELNNQLIVLQSHHPFQVKLRGQFELTNTGEYLFLGSPWISGMNEVKSMGLLLSDFAFHDPLIDLLHVIKTMEIANEDIKEIVGIYNEQRIELKQALKGKEEMAMFAMQSPSPIFRIDTSGTILLHNPASEQLTGSIYYKNKMFSVNDFAHQLVHDLMQTREPGTIIIKTKKHYYSLLCILVEKEGYFNVYANDITEQLQLESEVARSTNRLNSLITNLQSGVLLENENRTIALVNQQFCSLFGIQATPEQLTGADCTNAAEQSMSLFKDSKGFVNQINHILKDKKIVLGDQLELKDGRIFKRDFIPVWHKKEYLGHLWIYNDITIEANAKKAIEKQQLFYEEILNNIPADIAVFDEKHRYLFVNPVAVKNEELRKWLIGKTDKDYVELRGKSTLISQKRAEVFKTMKKEKKLLSFEEEIILPNGTSTHHLRNYYPVVDSNNRITIVIGYGINITERKIIEEELKKAKLEAEKAAKAKEEFLALMSHEIRTPLNGIMGLTEILESSGLTNEQHKLLSMLKYSEDNLLKIVNDVLEYEKITNNQLQLEKISFDIIETAEVILKTFQPKATEKNIQLYFEKNTKNLLVVGDSFRLSQIINNLLSNAVKFTDTGSVTFSISVSPMNDTDVCIDFKVRDTGIGIKKANLKKIFLPYVQESSSTTRFYGGTGLGLTITNKLLQLFGSELKIKSQKNKGSEFSFSLQLPISKKQITTKKTATKDTLELAGKKILVAEDAELNRFVIQKILEGTNCKYKFAFNGEEAVKKVNNEHFDLILMDIEMPLMNGVKATELIRKSRKAAIKNIPIIALTVNAFKENREEYLKAGINDYISKPFTKSTLLTTIAKVLNIRFSKQQLNLKGEEKLLNFGYIKSLSDDPQFLKKALKTFSNDSTKLIRDLELSIEKNNLENCLTILHKLKSAAGVTGMKRTRKSIVQLEMELKKKRNLSDHISSCSSIINDFNKAIAEVTNLYI